MRVAASEDDGVTRRLKHLGLNWLAGSPLPAHWFYPSPPPIEVRRARTGRLRIEIVSHCWGYSRLLAYQLTSLIEHPIRDADIRMTVYHAVEDEPTRALLDFVAEQSVANVTWNWQVLEPRRLFRRAIGRNLAALSSEADWVWFTDCDLTFQANCLDSLAAALQGRRDALVHPRVEAKTDVYADAEPIDDNAMATPQLLHVPPERFVAWPVTRATGPLQITHGDVARSVGYCNAVTLYQQPAARWQKAVEDRMFRYLLGTDGTPIDVEGVCRVQHVHKGRYRDDTSSARWRQRVRRWQHALRQQRR